MKPKVLIVDGDAPTRRAVQAALRDAGLALFEADHGAAALRLARAVQPDLVVLNLQLGGHPDALALIDAWQTDPERAITPLLLLGARGQAAERACAWQAGARHFVPLPVMAAPLRQAVLAMLALGGSPLQ